jgi:capsid protein
MHLMLGPSEELIQFKLERPSAMFAPFTEYVNKICCSAFGLSYEYLFTSWADSNFSSARINSLQTQAVIKANQKLAIQTTIMPLIGSLVKALVETGVVKTDMEIETILESIKVIPPQMPLLDPQREIQVATARMDANLSNLQVEAEKMGLGDYMAILQQKAREEEEKKALGLGVNEAPPATPGAKPQESSTRG